MTREEHAENLEDQVNVLAAAVRVLLARDPVSLVLLERTLNGADPPVGGTGALCVLTRLLQAAKQTQVPEPSIIRLSAERRDEGIIAYRSPEWPGGEVLAMNRLTFIEKRRSNVSYFPNTAVYFLYTDRVAGDAANELYIGESTNVERRLGQHQEGKDFWTHVVVASHHDLNSTQCKAVERELIAAVTSANSYRLANGVEKSSSETLTPLDEQMKTAFLSGLSQILSIARFQFLTGSAEQLFELRDQNEPEFRVRLVDAPTRRVVVLAGSKLRAPGGVPHQSILDANAQATGRLRDEEWIFERDQEVIIGATDIKLFGVLLFRLKGISGKSLSAALIQRASAPSA